MMRAASLSALIAAALLTGCGARDASGPAPGPASGLQAADAFLSRLREHCGQAFAGTLEVNEPADPADPFATQALVMHVRECGADELRIPFHVGTDRSRTWVLTRTASGLRLKHDHRHEDGSPDEVTMYGGDTVAPGSAGRQEFPADAESKTLFEKEGLTPSLDNVWAMEVENGQRFVYELSRPSGRRLRVAFDLSRPVPPPPPPWGSAEPAPAAGPAASGPVFSKCRLEHPSGLASFSAECATLQVAEDPARPEGRRVGLAIARIPAISRRKSPDPVFLIAGGPGMGSAEMYPSVAGAFARVGRDRDLILVDQRGTGGSAPLRCDFDDQEMLDFDPAALDAEIRRCLDTLQRSHDVAQFTTSVAVGDLERLRAALGYEQVNLYGVSYGSRVAQHYLRRHPERVRSVILDGVVPPGLALGPGIALDAEAALLGILGRCAGDADCRGAFGDPAALYRQLRTELADQPREVTLPDPRTGQPRTLRFGVSQLAVALRLSSYSAAQASLLPHALHAAARNDHYAPLAALFLMSAEGLREVIALGMHNSVVCAEDLPRVREADVDRERLAATYLGTDMIDALRVLCAAWPRGPVDPDFHQPLRSDTPVLLLSGSADPVTPPANGEAALRDLRNARHLVVPDEGHSQVGVHCMDRIFADFLREPAPATLDVACLERRRTPPFFVGAGGPAP
jgi:pimeloyl-ACP methyl ester carboxylesterase